MPPTFTPTPGESPAGPPPPALARRVLIVSAPGDAVQDDAIAPLLDERRWLRSRGTTLEHHREGDVDAILARVAGARPDVLLLATSWRRTPEETIDLCRRLRAQGAASRIVYFDTFDSTSTPYFGVLPYVDLYAKKQLLADLDRYGDDLAGGYVFTDHLERERGWELDGWRFGSAIPAGTADRLVLSWNLGAAPRLRSMLRRRVRPRPLRARRIDVFCRVALRSRNGSDWYSRHRLESLEILGRLGDGHRLVCHGGLPDGGDLVRPSRYRREMRHSRIAFSPFGWGEICYRDFEAACCGCLLVKPSVEHVRTEPDLFRPHETYVPVRWDLGDLEPACRRYLDDVAAAQAIVDKARAAYADYFDRHAVRAAITRLIG